MQPNNNGFNLKVVYAENGYGYTIPVNPSVLIESIKQSLVSATGLSPYDQILLADKNLAPNKTLESYGIVKDKEIYLFNRKILDNYNLKPEEVDISLQDFRKIPKKPTPNSLAEFESSPNPLNKLYAMEYHLKNHVIGIKYIKDEFERKLVTCQNYQSDIHHQKKALNAASFSFFDYRDNITNIENKFVRDFKNSIPNYDSILSSFELDMNKLKQIKLHESLRSNNRVTLADCVPEADFRKWHKQCKEEFDALKTKILDLDNQFYNTVKISDNELKRPDPINMNELAGRMQNLKEHFERVKTANLSFASNYEKITLTLDQTRTINDPNRILSMLSGFLDIKKQQDDSFAYCSNNTNAFEAISFICKSKNFMNSHVYNYLRSISKFQEKFREIKSTLSLYDEAIKKFQDNFIQLEIIHRLPQAYEESLLEINRRKKFGNNITCSLARFIESLKSIRDNENEKRQMFVNQYLQYIPISSFHGLKEQLPEFNVSLPPFDTNLPNLGAGNIGSGSSGINNNSSGSSNLGSGFSGGSNGSNEDDGFTLVIDNLTDNFNNNFINNNNNNNNNNSNNNNNNLNSLVNSNINNNNNNNNNLTTSNINNSSIINNNNKKLLNDLEKSQIEKQQLEMRLQTTFLMASKSEEKYKDLLEKSKMYNESFLEKQSNESKRIEELKKELEDKKREITLLSDELAKAAEDTLVNQQSLITLQEKNNELADLVEVLKLKIQESETGLETLQKEHLLKENAYNEQMTSAVEDFNDKKNTIDTLRTEINQSTAKITELEELITNLQLDNQTSIKENQNLVIENGQLKLENDELKLQSSELLAKLDALKLESDQISLDLNTTIETLSKENEQLKSGSELKIGEFESKTLQLGETTKKLEQVNRSLQDTISNLNIEKETLAQSLSTIRIENSSLQASSQTLQQDNLLLQKEKQTLENANERLKQKIAEAEQSLDTAEKESIVEKGKYLKLVDELELLRSELQQHGHSSNEKYQQLQQLNLDLAKERQLHQQSEQINKQLEQQNQNLQDEVKVTNEKLTDLTLSYQTVKQLLNEQMEEVEKSNVTNNELSSTVNKLNNEIAKLQQELEKLSSKLSHSQQTLTSTLDQTTKNYQAKIVSMDQQISQLESLNQETQRESLIKENENNNLKSEVETLKIELERSKTAESKHTKDLEDLQSYFNGELSRVEGEYDKLKLKSDEHLANNATLKEMMKKDKIIHKKEMDSLADREKYFRDQEKVLEDKDKIIAEKDKFITDLRNKFNQTTNLMPEVQALRSAVYEISKIIDPSAKEPLQPDALVVQVNKIFIEDVFQNRQLLDRVSNLETQQALERSQSALISNFTHDRNVVFYKNKNGFYEAVNIDSPNYFLSPISLEQYSNEMKPDQPFIGTIIQVDSKIAGNSDSFGCLPGTEIYEVLVSKLEN